MLSKNTSENMRTITNEYIRERLSKGQRDDKRGPWDFRNITIETNAIPNAEGSALVTMGNTKMLCGIKIDLAEPMRDTPKDGNLTTSAELLPMAADHFETGPPSPEAVEFGRVVDRGIRAAEMIDTSKLFIEEGKVWSVYIDLYVLNYDGNLFDAGTLAAVSALSSARMPKYEDAKVIRDGMLEKLEISNMSTSCTFAKISDSLLLDPNGAEEELMKTRVTISNDEKVIRAMQKGLGGSFTPKELDSLIDIAFDKSKELRSVIKKAIGE